MLDARLTVWDRCVAEEAPVTLVEQEAVELLHRRTIRRGLTRSRRPNNVEPLVRIYHRLIPDVGFGNSLRTLPAHQCHTNAIAYRCALCYARPKNANARQRLAFLDLRGARVPHP